MTVAPRTGPPSGMEACDSSDFEFSFLDCFDSSPGASVCECDLLLPMLF